MRLKTLAPLLFILWGALAALACTLSSNASVPPTLVPRVTDTPLPTIGYATLSPTELPQVQQQAPPSGPAYDADLAQLLEQVDSDRLFAHIDALQRMESRHVNSSMTDPNKGVGAAYRYIRGQFDAIKQNSNGRFNVYDYPFPVKWNDVESTQINVVGVIQGTAVGAGIVLLGAHYDSISIDRNDPNYYAPGADDDASGVAALIEMARVLSARPHRASIMFVAFGAEEIGRKGSIAFVDNLKERGIHIDAMLTMDIIGSSTGPSGQVIDNQIRMYSAGPNESPSRQLARGLHTIAANYTRGMEIVVNDAGDRQGRYSDHLSFSDAGMPAVRYVEAAEDVTRQHTPRDTIDDIQATYLRRATQTIMAGVTALADGPSAPRNVALRANPSGTRTLTWEPVPGAASYIVALRYPNSLVYNLQFTWNTNFVEWEKFTSDYFAGVAVYAVDAGGLMGPPSTEVLIP
jgi:hypothetical protein